MDGLGSARITLDIWLCHDISVQFSEIVVFLMNDDNDKGREDGAIFFSRGVFTPESPAVDHGHIARRKQILQKASSCIDRQL